MANGSLSITMDKADYKILAAKLEQLERIERNAAVGKGLRKGEQVIINQGKQNLRARNKRVTGKLAGSFATQLRASKAYIAGGFKRPAGAVSHLVDRGTEERWTKSGAYRGSVSAGNPNNGSMFWTDAVNEKGQEALEVLADEINKEIERIFNA